MPGPKWYEKRKRQSQTILQRKNLQNSWLEQMADFYSTPQPRLLQLKSAHRSGSVWCCLTTSLSPLNIETTTGLYRSIVQFTSTKYGHDQSPTWNYHGQQGISDYRRKCRSPWGWSVSSRKTGSRRGFPSCADWCGAQNWPELHWSFSVRSDSSPTQKISTPLGRIVKSSLATPRLIVFSQIAVQINISWEGSAWRLESVDWGFDGMGIGTGVISNSGSCLNWRW